MEAEGKGRSNAKVRAYTTAWAAFDRTLNKLGFPLDKLTCQTAEWTQWDEDRYTMHETLLDIYVVEISKGHQRAETAVTYARSVAKSWIRVHGTVLWPEPMFEQLKDTTKGFARIKDFAKRERAGLTAADITVLLATLQEWVRTGKQWGRRAREVWDTRLAASVSAALCFCYGLLYRFGDATVPDGEDFDPRERLTRASVWHSEKQAGVPATMSVDPPVNKCANVHTGRMLSGLFSSDSINWPTAVDNLMACDPVASHLRHTTPLFRDTRTSKLDSKARNGTYEAGGLPLSGKFMRRVIRGLVADNKFWFGDRVPSLFGVHSMRIGALNDALDSGATLFDVVSLGRWTSESVFAYHRMPRAKRHEWQKRSIDVSRGTARADMIKAGVSEEVADRRQSKLDSAANACAFTEQTRREVRPRIAGLSGRAMAEKAKGQLTLDGWRKRKRTTPTPLTTEGSEPARGVEAAAGGALGLAQAGYAAALHETLHHYDAASSRTYHYDGAGAREVHRSKR